MQPFPALRQYIETHEAELRAAAEDQATFARELAALKDYWQSDDDPDLLAAETERVLRKHPAVWARIEPPPTPAPVEPPTRPQSPRPASRKEQPL